MELSNKFLNLKKLLSPIYTEWQTVNTIWSSQLTPNLSSRNSYSEISLVNLKKNLNVLNTVSKLGHSSDQVRRNVEKVNTK